jgi:hypothetical protein
MTRVLLLVALLTPEVGVAATLAVPSGYTTIADALLAAVDGDVIELADGDYSGEGQLAVGLVLDITGMTLPGNVILPPMVVSAPGALTVRNASRPLLHQVELDLTGPVPNEPQKITNMVVKIVLGEVRQGREAGPAVMTFHGLKAGYAKLISVPNADEIARGLVYRDEAEAVAVILPTPLPDGHQADFAIGISVEARGGRRSSGGYLPTPTTRAELRIRSTSTSPDLAGAPGRPGATLRLNGD